MTAKWPLMDRFWAPELAKQACSRAVNIGDRLKKDEQQDLLNFLRSL